MQQEFYSNGKLLISGEYAILDGAWGLAVPTKFGQSLHVKSNTSNTIIWKSINHEGNIWFEAVLDLERLKEISSSDEAISKTLTTILKEAKKLNSGFLRNQQGFDVETILTFPREWGLGTSSTLINNIAQWAGVDAHKLLWNSFGGSGYDISCAQHNKPILYQLKSGMPHVKEVDFNPDFKNDIYFIYLNQKQNSREAIENYRKKEFEKKSLVANISQLTREMVNAPKKAFENLIEQHEKLMASILGIAPIKERLFPDYFGALKSLGAWGGDFIIATGNEKTPEYFTSKGFDTVLSFEEMVL